MAKKKRESHGKRWTKREDVYLLQNWGMKHPAKIAKNLGRSLSATKRRAYIVCGTKKMNRGGYSVRSLAQETGYHYTQIRKAIVALGLESRVRQKGKHTDSERRWGKGWDNRTWLINDINAEKILEWLGEEEYSEAYLLHFKAKGEKHHAWAKKYDKCIECGTTERKHVGKGLCYSCKAKPRLALLREETAKRKAERAKWWDAKRELKECTGCGRSDRPHHAKGLCDACYQSAITKKAVNA